MYILSPCQYLVVLAPSCSSHLKVLGRVTRLGDNSPNGRLFSLGSFLKIYRSSPHFLCYSFPKHTRCINFYKKMVGLHFGRVFQKHIWSPWFYALSTHGTTILFSVYVFFSSAHDGDSTGGNRTLL
jgi:hypothetical protein